MPRLADRAREGGKGGWLGFLRDTRGIAAVYIGLSSTLLFGATALAFDLGRVMSLQSELQSAADAAALSGAAELDGQANAITRAKAAAGCPGSNVAGAFGTNSQTFATDGNGNSVSVAFCVFFSALTTPDPALLPPNNSAQGGTSTTSDTSAQFIKVVVQVRSVANAFITMVGGPQIASTTATATAGFTQSTCSALPLFICNPLETNTNKTFNPSPGEQMLVTPGGGGAWAPGNYGYTNPPDNVSSSNSCLPHTNNGGTADLTKFLANDQPLGCFSTTINTRTGNPTPAATGLNVRFDMYPTGAGQLGGNPQNNACYAPAPDVVKGTVPGTRGASGTSDPCNPQAASPPAAEAFPQDACFTSGTNCNVSGVLGKGDWDLNTYWADNHGGTPPGALTTFAQGMSPTGITPSGIPSRYATYLYEINNSLIPAAGTPAGHVESGAPACYGGSTAPITPARRLINVAVVDCNEQGVTGNTPGVRPVGFLQGFMILPADGANGNLFLEVVQVVQPNGTNGILHNVVQLYR